MESRLTSVFVLALIFTSFCCEADPGLRFIQNRKQWTDGALYAADIQGGRVRLYTDKLRFTLMAPKDSEKAARKNKVNTSHQHEYSNNSLRVHIYDMHLAGANQASRVEGQHEYETRYNYFLGNDTALWASDVKAFSAVRYENVYAGIDLKVYSQNELMKYEWIVKAQAKPSTIKVRYNGLDGICTEGKNLRLITSVGDGWEMAPYAYQLKNGFKIDVPCEYVLKGEDVTYSFPQGYDECYDLVIDPILIFSAYSGSTLDNWGNTATYDSRGNVYSGGMVQNPYRINGFPTTPGAYQVSSAGGDWDIGILKYDSSGSTLLYATYLGGNDTETPQSLVVNSNNELLILGATGSANFPVTNNSQFKKGDRIDPIGGVLYNEGTDIFIAKLSANGSQLVGSTYLGGTNNDGVNFISGQIYGIKTESPLARNYGDQLRGDIITDKDDFVYIASSTRSSDFPAFNTDTLYTYKGGLLDAVLVKLTPNLSSVVWSRFIGGNKEDAAYSVKVSGDTIFVAGGSNSPAIAGMDGLHPSPSGDVDGWIQSLPKDGSRIIHGTFLGTSSYDQTYFIDLNEFDEVYTFGQTLGAYPVQGNVYSNPNSGQFIHKLTNDLKTTIFSTVIGSGTKPPNISPTAFLVSDCNNLYLSGWGGQTNSARIEQQNGPDILFNYLGGSTHNLPVAPNAFKTTTSGNDFYLMVLSADASEFLYGTYFGGNISATHVDGGTSRFDKQGIVYHAVCAGCGGESDFPAVNVPAKHSRNGSSNCNNAVFKFDLALLKARIQTNSVWLNSPGLNKICIPDKIVFQNRCSGGKTFEWDLGDGTMLTKTDTSAVTHQYKNTGRFIVRLKALDPGTCKVMDETFTFVDVFMKQAVVQEDDAICEGTSYTLQASGGVAYAWKAGDGSVLANSATPGIFPSDTTQYVVTITEATGCITQDTVNINVIPKVEPAFDFSMETECLSRPVLNVSNTTENAEDAEMIFYFGDNETSDLLEAAHQYEKDGTYDVKLMGRREFCVYETTSTILIYVVRVPNIITPGLPEGKNDVFVVQYGETEGVTPADFGLKASLVVYNRWGKKIFEDDNYLNTWSGEGLASGVYYYDVIVEGHSPCRSWVQVVK